MNQVSDAVALMLVRTHFSGLRDYPLHEDGQRCLAMHLAKYCLSVTHATAVSGSFRGQCPTPQELHDVAYNENVRAKFLPPQPSLKEKWISEGATLDSSYYDRMMEQEQQNPSTRIADDRMWAAIKRKLVVKEFSRVSWGQIWATARDLGFPLELHQIEQADQWDAIKGKREVRPISSVPGAQVA